MLLLEQQVLLPSLLLSFLSRTVIAALMLFVACALPFFGAIMGYFNEYSPLVLAGRLNGMYVFGYGMCAACSKRVEKYKVKRVQGLGAAVL